MGNSFGNYSDQKTHSLQIKSGKDKINISNILLGEVWLHLDSPIWKWTLIIVATQPTALTGAE